MRAIARLVFSYFTCTPLLRAFSAVGLAGILALSYAIQHLHQGDVMIWSATLAIGAFSIGSALMPLMFGRMARSHLMRVLPYGRLKLLASAYITVLIVALPMPVLTYLGYMAGGVPEVPDPVKLAQYVLYVHQTFWLTLTTATLVASWLYVAMWFVSSERSIAGYVKGLLVVMFIIYAPSHALQNFSETMLGSLTQIGGTWLVFGTGFLLWPRWKAFSARRRLWPAGGLGVLLKKRVSGREIDLLLGTANPWLLIAAQVAPIVFASTIGFYSPAVWLFYLTIFSTVAGGIAGQAAERSRTLWLRGDWSRDQLFWQVERSFWRHNGYVLGVLIALMVVIGSYTALPVILLAAGLPLLALGTVLSTYIGLMLTRGLRAVEAILAIAVMLALMAVAVIAARSEGEANDLVTVIILEVLLAVLALVLRGVAKKRWARIDWMLCRRDRGLVLRAAS